MFQENEIIAYPLVATEVFESCELLVSLLNELDDDELEATACCLQDAAASPSIIAAVCVYNIVGRMPTNNNNSSAYIFSVCI